MKTTEGLNSVAYCSSKRERGKLRDVLYEKLGGEWCGNVCPPLDHKTLWLNEDIGKCVAYLEKEIGW